MPRNNFDFRNHTNYGNKYSVYGACSRCALPTSIFLMAMMASASSGNPYENYNNAEIEQDLIDPDDGMLYACFFARCRLISLY